jgi:NAD+ kinase
MLAPLSPPRRFLILYHAQADRAADLAEDIAAYLTGQPQVQVAHACLEEAEVSALVGRYDLVIALGGDGTMLRAGRLAAPGGVPVLGINLGRLGFLTEVQPTEWPDVLARVLRGDFWIEDRMMLRVEHLRGPECLGVYEALNEVVVGRGALSHPVRLSTLIDGGEITTYLADGLIVATPTGSTAYALAAGGPILPPELRNILLIAIAPHLSVDRAIVLAQGSTVEVVAHSEHEMHLTPDGELGAQLEDGDRVRVRMSEHLARFARVRPSSYFYTTLMARMTRNPSV